jgi:hypothetical protein
MDLLWRKRHGIALIAFVYVLPLLIADASSTRNWYWISVTAVIGPTLLVTMLANYEAQLKDYHVYKSHSKYGRKLTFVLICLVTLLLLGIANLQLFHFLPLEILESIVHLASYVLPILDRYETIQIVAGNSSQLDSQQIAILKLQLSAIVAFLVAPLAVPAILIGHFSVPSKIRHMYFRSTGRTSNGPLMMFFITLFAAYCAWAVFTGSLEFDPMGSSSRHRAMKCLFHVGCYAGDSLLIFLSAWIKILAFCGFPLGAILVIDQVMLSDGRKY